MELHNLKPAKGSVKSNKRLGRGEGSGYAGTSGRGHKGAKSRSGYSKKRHFEGGQMPLQMRLPKRGFKSRVDNTYVPINLYQLQHISEKYEVTDINRDLLIEKGMIKKGAKIKILGKGELEAKLNVSANAISQSAKEKIEEKGGSFNLAK